MITKVQKMAIKKVLGTRYCKPISEALIKKNVLNKKGEPHSDNMITQVMNGQEHIVIEDVIFDLVELKKTEKEAIILERERILKR